MLPELHEFKVLFYAESVGVITSGHVTKLAVTQFDLQRPMSRSRFAGYDARRVPAGLPADGQTRRQRDIASQQSVSGCR